MGLQVDFWSPKMQNVFLKPSQNASEIPFPPGVSPYLRRVSKFPRPVPFAKPIGGCPEITNFTQISHRMISGTITRYPWFHMIWNYVLWNRVCWGYRFHTLWKKQENHEIVTIPRHSTIWDAKPAVFPWISRSPWDDGSSTDQNGWSKLLIFFAAERAGLWCKNNWIGFGVEKSCTLRRTEDPQTGRVSLNFQISMGRWEQHWSKWMVKNINILCSRESRAVVQK